MSESPSLAAAILAKLDTAVVEQPVQAAKIIMFGQVDEPVSAASDIAALLQSARSAHLNYRQALKQRQFSAAAEFLIAAARARAEAETADPNHADPVWQDDASSHQFQQVSHDDLHGGLLTFYLKELSREANGA